MLTLITRNNPPQRQKKAYYYLPNSNPMILSPLNSSVRYSKHFIASSGAIKSSPINVSQCRVFRRNWASGTRRKYGKPSKIIFHASQPIQPLPLRAIAENSSCIPYMTFNDPDEESLWVSIYEQMDFECNSDASSSSVDPYSNDGCNPSNASPNVSSSSSSSTTFVKFQNKFQQSPVSTMESSATNDKWVHQSFQDSPEVPGSYRWRTDPPDDETQIPMGGSVSRNLSAMLSGTEPELAGHPLLALSPIPDRLRHVDSQGMRKWQEGGPPRVRETPAATLNKLEGEKKAEESTEVLNPRPK